MTLISLFWSFTKIGLLAVGGAYSFLPLLERELVQRYCWLTKEEFLDVLGVTNTLPGAISIKYATYTGYKIAGIMGVMAANLGNALGPIVLVIVVSSLYSRYKDASAVKGAFNMVRLAVFGMILAVAFQLISMDQLLRLRNLPIIIISFLLFMFTKIHPAVIIIMAGLIGALYKLP